MTELHLPWLLLTLLTTGLGAVWVARTRDPGLARRRAVETILGPQVAVLFRKIRRRIVQRSRRILAIATAFHRRQIKDQARRGIFVVRAFDSVERRQIHRN